jgi:hypothetical protein
VINNAVFTPSSITVLNGEVATMTYTDATDSVEVDNNIDTLCGPRTYTIYNNDETTSPDWVILSGPVGGVYTITATPVLDSLVGTSNFKLETALDYYPSHAVDWTTITVAVQGANCEQEGLEWDVSATVEQTIDVSTGPTVVTIAPYTPNVASKTATPQMRACSGVFDETYTLAALQSDGSALPAFMVDNGDGTVTSTPTISDHMGEWTLQITQVNTYGDDAVWDGVIITVGCTISTITPDAAPNSGLTYTLYDGPLIIDLSTWAYTQTPPCDYTIVSSYTWAIPADASSFV